MANDIYGGYLSLPAPGGATGHFRTEKFPGGRWLLVTPLGNALFMTGVYYVVGDDHIDEQGSSYNARILVKYASADTNKTWSNACTTRLQSWGFNTIGPGSWHRMYGFNADANPKMPFVTTGPNPGITGWDAGAESFKLLYTGVDPLLYGPVNPATGKPDGRFPDSYAPEFKTNAEALFAASSELALSKVSPYFIGMFGDDTDFLNGFGPGVDFPTDPLGKYHWHLGYLALVTAPTQTYNVHASDISRTISAGATVSDSTTLTLTHPVGHRSGDRVLYIIGVDGAPTIGATTGWNQTVVANGSACTLLVLWRNFDGTESASVTFASLFSSAQMVSRVGVRYYKGAFDPAQAPDIVTATGTGATATPPSNTAAWGSANNHILAGAIFDNGTRGIVDTAPTDYRVVGEAGALGNAGSTITIVAARDLTGATDAPDGVAINASEAWVSFTIISKPQGEGFPLYLDDVVYTKVALRDFLTAKYGTIAALNAAWGGSTYTAFGSDPTVATTYNQGFNFRAAGGPPPTDGANETGIFGSTGGGWDTGLVDAATRDTGIGPHLAGINYKVNTGTQGTWSRTLPAPGTYTMRIALGDQGSAQGYQYLQVLDDTTVKFTLDISAGTAAGHFIDAMGTDRTTATWEGSNSSRSVTFATTNLRIKLGSPTAHADASTLAHVSVVSSGPVGGGVGWPEGSGIMDENGGAKHSAWLGTSDQFYLTGMNAGVKTDLDLFLYEMSKKFFTVERDAFKLIAPNKLFLGPTNLGGAGWRCPTRGPILKAAGEVLDLMATSTDGSQAQMDFIGLWAGDVPLTIWEGTTANPDSSRFLYTMEAASWVVSTQAARATLYTTDLTNLLSRRPAVRSVYPFVGHMFWQFVDNFSEQANWGLVTFRDNQYDGVAAQIAAGTDTWGFPTGGEVQNYGNFLGPVITAHAGIEATLAAQIAAADTTPPTITITSPTSSSTFASSVSPIVLGGIASDAVGVTLVTWANDRGGSGMATGTTTWSVGVILQLGVNVLTANSHDAAGNSSPTATCTVTYIPPTPPSASVATGLRGPLSRGRRFGS